MSDLVFIERHGTSAVLRMNRVEKQNALSRALFEAIDAALVQLEADAGVRGIVITGAQSVFSTGGDLKEALAVRSVEDTRRWLELFRRVNERIESIGKPVIAATHGWCVTGGLELALACDIRIAATNAQFGITSSRITPGAAAAGGADAVRHQAGRLVAHPPVSDPWTSHPARARKGPPSRSVRHSPRGISPMADTPGDRPHHGR